MSALPNNRKTDCCHHDKQKDECHALGPGSVRYQVFDCQGCAAYYPKGKVKPLTEKQEKAYDAIMAKNEERYEDTLVMKGAIAISVETYDELVVKAKAYERLHVNLKTLRDSMLARLTALIKATEE